MRGKVDGAAQGDKNLLLNFRLKTASVATSRSTPSARQSSTPRLAPHATAPHAEEGCDGTLPLGLVSGPCQDQAKWSITRRHLTANNEPGCILEEATRRVWCTLIRCRPRSPPAVPNVAASQLCVCRGRRHILPVIGYVSVSSA
ncbi:hypothetical protein E2C01_068348 [Portunus trituberculatus]|uniref:Uncharacterized protein n=1 Tax=Portunus trituberculatus TaxID=210409 RepID=A0A5B7HZT0_PORTR|nr:hypothetical protein [Portunus trituberculatus]